jgi:hypothetical protein
MEPYDPSLSTPQIPSVTGNAYDDARAGAAARDKARAAVQEAQQALRHGAEAVKQKTQKVAASASSSLKEQAAHLRDGAERAYRSSAAAVRSGYETGVRRMTSGTAVCRREITRHPISIVTGAVAVGLLVGLAVGRMSASRSV